MQVDPKKGKKTKETLRKGDGSSSSPDEEFVTRWVIVTDKRMLHAQEEPEWGADKEKIKALDLARQGGCCLSCCWQRCCYCCWCVGGGGGRGCAVVGGTVVLQCLLVFWVQSCSDECLLQYTGGLCGAMAV